MEDRGLRRPRRRIVREGPDHAQRRNGSRGLTQLASPIGPLRLACPAGSRQRPGRAPYSAALSGLILRHATLCSLFTGRIRSIAAPGAHFPLHHFFPLSSASRSSVLPSTIKVEMRRAFQMFSIGLPSTTRISARLPGAICPSSFHPSCSA
jgi:hypothetical protein